MLSVLLVVIGAAMVLTASGQDCTPATCGDVPVVVYFEYANCTGAREYYILASEDEQVCEVAGSSSAIKKVTDDGVEVYYTINNPTCDLSLEDSTYNVYTYKYGVCNMAGSKKRDDESGETSLPGFASRMSRRAAAAWSGASMVLRNVNATFAAPQDYDNTNPTSLESFIHVFSFVNECYSPGNCTLPDGTPAPFYRTRYSEEANCSSAYESHMPRVQFELSTCYWNPGYGYSKLLCTSPTDLNIYDVEYYNDPECTTLFGTHTWRLPCLGASAFSPVATFCNVYTAPIPTAPLASPSSSPTPTPDAPSPSPTSGTPTPASHASLLRCSGLLASIIALFCLLMM